MLSLQGAGIREQGSAEGAGVAAEFPEGIEGVAPDDALAEKGEEDGAEHGVEDKGCRNREGEDPGGVDAVVIARGLLVEQSDHEQREDADDADAPGSHEKSGQRHEAHDEQAEPRAQKQADAKAEGRVDVLGEIVEHAEDAGGPVKLDESGTEDEVLAIAAVV